MTKESLGLWSLLRVALLGVFVLAEIQQVSGGNTMRVKREPQGIVIEDVSDLSVFYSLKDSRPLRTMMPRPWITPGQSLRLPFIGDPCACSGLQCGCCAGIKIDQFNIDKKVCANVSYDPFLFALVLDVTVNQDSVVHQVFSAKNPPPICIPVPIGAIPGITFCIKIFDIFTPGVRNIHFCMDWEIQIFSSPVLILHFDCLRIGADGVVLLKPEDQGGVVSGVSNAEEQIANLNSTDSEIFDEIIIEKNSTIPTIELHFEGEALESLSNSTSKPVNKFHVSQNTIIE